MWRSLFSVREHETSRDRWLGYGAALLAMVVVSMAIGLLLSIVDIANVSILYLIAVLLVSIRFGRGPAIMVAVAAFFAFNWFFVAPVHTFRLDKMDAAD